MSVVTRVRCKVDESDSSSAKVSKTRVEERKKPPPYSDDLFRLVTVSDTAISPFHLVSNRDKPGDGLRVNWTDHPSYSSPRIGSYGPER